MEAEHGLKHILLEELFQRLCEKEQTRSMMTTDVGSPLRKYEYT